MIVCLIDMDLQRARGICDGRLRIKLKYWNFLIKYT